MIPFHCLAVQRPDREHLADVGSRVAIKGSANMTHSCFTVETVQIHDVAIAVGLREHLMDLVIVEGHRRHTLLRGLRHTYPTEGRVDAEMPATGALVTHGGDRISLSIEDTSRSRGRRAPQHRRHR